MVDINVTLTEDVIYATAAAAVAACVGALVGERSKKFDSALGLGGLAFLLGLWVFHTPDSCFGGLVFTSPASV